MTVGPPALNHYALSKEFSRRIGWIKADAGLKDMMARLVMLAMHKDGRIELSPPKWRQNQPGPITIGPADRTNNRSKRDGCEVRLIDGALGGSLQRRPLSPLRMWRWTLETESSHETAVTWVAVAASRTVNGFMAERDAARARVGELTLINAAERKALLEQVTCDTIPENLVAPLGNTYFLVRDELPRISCNLTPIELKDSINTLVTGTANTGHESGIRLDTDNADQAYRHAWRFILAPGGRAQAKAILGQLAPGQSHLRRICEAADWYANSFKQTSEAMRTLGDDGPDPFEGLDQAWRQCLSNPH